MLRILMLEASPEDAVRVERALGEAGIPTDFIPVKSRREFISALEAEDFDLALVGETPNLNASEAIRLVREKRPGLNAIRILGALDPQQVLECMNAGATICVAEHNTAELVAAVRREEERMRLLRANRGMARLVAAVQELSLARDLDGIMAVVRRAARELTGADGATFVLRDGDRCHYADENAIAPLWKGQKFPLTTCISGWAMLNRQPAVIEDIYADARIPVAAYRPTFVKSLAMVPIRTESPIGAIGNYWAKKRLPTTDEVELLQALANTTAVAMENVRVYSELEQRIKDRTSELEFANRELESFSGAVSHDLRAPLRSVQMFSKYLAEESSALSANGQRYLSRVSSSAQQMQELIEDLLTLSRVGRSQIERTKVDLSALANEILAAKVQETPQRKIDVHVAEGMETEGDAGTLRIAIENLLSNAWKYTGKCERARIEFTVQAKNGGPPIFTIRDNGAGFDMQYAEKLFQPFQRLHGQDEFPGSGIGLTTVQRIIHRHGGRIWVEAKVDKGAAFHFTLGS